jgi:uncharacterized RDD family membrane protein YckC
MTQPPDDRLLPPDESDPIDAGDEPAAPENAPTVTWSPPESQAPSGAPPPGEPAPPSGPIISAAPTTPPAPGWQQPGAPPPLPAAVSGGGWEMPTTSPPVAQEGGYVAGGVGARFVAWLIDGVLSSIVPGAIALVLLDWTTFLRGMFDQVRFDASGRVISGAMTIPITTELILITLIYVGTQFLYFVGFWTSRWQSTPGMIGLKMKVVDANTGAGLTMMQATKRWIALGWPLSLLFLVPVLQNAAGLAQFGLNVFLFFSTVTNDRKQGLHDKFAGSQVIRSVTSGNGATVVGCLVYIVMLIAISIVASLVLFVVAGPALIDFAREMPRYAP